VSNFIASVENSFQQPLVSTDNDSIGYEEIPRAKPTIQTATQRKNLLEERAHSDWDDDTLSSNFNSDNDNDNDNAKRINQA
jgi:hypothetical protein